MSVALRAIQIYTKKNVVSIAKNTQSNYKIKESRILAEYRTEHPKTNKATQISMIASSRSTPPNRGSLRKFCQKRFLTRELKEESGVILHLFPELSI